MGQPRRLVGRLWSVVVVAGAVCGLAMGLQAQPVTIAPVRVMVSVRPPEVVTLMVDVENGGAGTANLSLAIEAPEGWRAVAVLDSIELGSGDSELVLLPMRVPSNAIAGNYTVSVSLEDSSTGLVVATTQIGVVILSNPGLEVLALNRRSGAAPGSSAEYIVEVRNSGNTTIEYAVMLEGMWPAEAQPSTGRLAPGETERVGVSHAVPDGTTSRTEDWLAVRVSLREAAHLGGGLTLVTRALPLPASAVSRSLWERLNARMDIEASGGLNTHPGWTSMSFTAEAQFGTNSLGIDFTLRPLFGPEPMMFERGRVELTLENSEFALGNVELQSSALASFSCFGSNLRFAGQYGELELSTGVLGDAAHVGGALHAGPAWMRIGGFYAERRSPTERAQALLATIDSAPGEALNLHAEGGLGWDEAEPGAGALVELEYSGSVLSLSASSAWCSPWLVGPYSDSGRFDIRGELDLPSLSMRAGYASTRTNVLGRIDRDSLRKDTWDGRFSVPNAEWMPSISLDARVAWARGIEGGASHDTVKREFTARLGGILGNVSYGLSGELVYETDRIGVREDVLLALLARSTFPLLDQVSFSLGVDYSSLLNFATGLPTGDSLDVSVSLTSADSPGTMVTSWTTSLGIHELNVQLDLPVSEQLLLGASGTWMWSQDDSIPPSLRWSLRIGTRFAIPVPFLTTKGQIEGCAFLDEDGDGERGTNEPGVSGVLLSTGEAEALSDDSGNYRFPASYPGEVTVTLAAFPPEVIPVLSTPPQAVVTAGRRTVVDVPLARGASIQGVVYSIAEENPGGVSIVGVGSETEGPMAGVVVRLTGSGGSFTMKSSLGGTFRFERLVPGKWTLLVEPTSLPPHHRPAEEALVLELGSGEAAEVDLPVLIARRTIKLLDGNGLQVQTEGEP